MKLRTRGFKGRSFTDGIALSPLTYINGPNGAGKSRILEAVHFAVFGTLPSRYQQTNQASAELFSPEGGYCELEDDDGRWIRHELSWKGSSVKVTRTTSDDQGTQGISGENPFAGNRLLLDFGAFEALRPEEKGRYILELCGSDLPATEAKVMRRIETSLAKRIGGPMATKEHLRALDERLPEKARDVARQLVGSTGILRQLESFLDGRDRPSVACLKLLDYAQGQLNEERARKREFDSQLAGLKTDDTAQKIREADVHQLERKHDAVLKTLHEAEKVSGELDRAMDKWSFYAEQKEKLELRYEEVEEAFRRAEDPGPRPPDRVELPEPPKNWFKEIQAINSRLEGIERELQKKEFNEGELKRLEAELAEVEEVSKKHESTATYRLIRLCLGYPDDKEFQGARQLAQLAAKEHEDEEKKITEKIVFLKSEIFKVSGVVQHIQDQEYPKLQEELVEKKVQLAGEEAEWGAEMTLLQDSYQASLRSWDSAKQKRKTAERDLEAIKEEIRENRIELNGAHLEMMRLKAKAKAAETEKIPGLREEEEKLREEARRARELLGRYASYLDVAAGQEESALREEAWKESIGAVKEVREDFVREAAARLLDAANTHYSAVSPDEKISIQLETPTGKTTCRFEVLRGDTHLSDKALSEGEWMLALTAFSLAAAGLSKGKRILLIEAQPLDPGNLLKLLQMIGLSGTKKPTLALVAATIPDEELRGELPGNVAIIEVMPKKPTDEEKAEVSKRGREQAIRIDNYFNEVRRWWNDVVSPRLGKKKAGRVGKKRQKAILALREKQPDWMEIITEHLEYNLGIQDKVLVGFDEFLKESFIDDWKKHRYDAPARRGGKTSELPPDKERGLSGEEVVERFKAQ